MRQPTEEEMIIAAEVYDQDLSRLIKDFPFYGMLLVHHKAEFVGPQKTADACINLTHIYLNCISEDDCEAYQNRPTLQRLLMLKHLVMHPALDHFNIPKGIDVTTANIAQDAEIHRIFHKDPTILLQELPQNMVMPVSDNKQDLIGFTYKNRMYYVPDYNGKTWLQIYHDIYEQVEQHKNSSTPLLENDREDLGSDVKNDPNYHSYKEKLVATEQVAKNFGTVPAEIEQIIHEYLYGKIDWKYELQNYLSSVIQSYDYSHRFNNRLRHLGIMSPKIAEIYTKNVWFVVDTSFSMSEDELKQALTEVLSSKQAESFNLHFMCCDAKAYDAIHFGPDEHPELKDLKITGRGGTDFRPAFNKINDWVEDNTEPDLVIYYTDTGGRFPTTKPTYPVLWISTIKTESIPFGKVINI